MILQKLPCMLTYATWYKFESVPHKITLVDESWWLKMGQGDGNNNYNSYEHLHINTRYVHRFFIVLFFRHQMILHMLTHIKDIWHDESNNTLLLSYNEKNALLVGKRVVMSMWCDVTTSMQRTWHWIYFKSLFLRTHCFGTHVTRIFESDFCFYFCLIIL